MSWTRNTQGSAALLVELLRLAEGGSIAVHSARVGQDAAVLNLEDEADAWQLAAVVQAGVASRRTRATPYRFGVRLDNCVAPADVHTALLEVRGLDRRRPVLALGATPVTAPASAEQLRTCLPGSL